MISAPDLSFVEALCAQVDFPETPVPRTATLRWDCGRNLEKPNYWMVHAFGYTKQQSSLGSDLTALRICLIESAYCTTNRGCKDQCVW